MLCAAPTVLIAIANAPRGAAARRARGVRVLTAGAPPAAATIERIEGEFGWEITHVYGLTETAPFITICEPRARARATSPRRERADDQGAPGRRAGRRRASCGSSTSDGNEVPHDGETVGEIVVRGNVVMEGYYNDPEATGDGVRGGCFHTGDAAVVHPTATSRSATASRT